MEAAAGKGTIEVHVRTFRGPSSGSGSGSGPLERTRFVGRAGQHSTEFTLSVASSAPVAALKRAICEQPHVGPPLDPDALLLFLVRITSSTSSKHSSTPPLSQGSYVPLGIDDADDERSLAEAGVTHGACVEFVFPRPGLVQLAVEFRMARTIRLFVRFSAPLRSSLLAHSSVSVYASVSTQVMRFHSNDISTVNVHVLQRIQSILISHE